MVTESRGACRRRLLFFADGCIGCSLLLLISVMGGCLLLIIAGIVYQSVGEVLALGRHPPPGQLVDVGDHRLHLHCTGERASPDDPVVVLDAGLGGMALDWVWVQPAVSEFARVCAYDRAGYGWSDAGPGPRDSHQVVTELHTLLTNADVPPPYVMVGQSFGGLNARHYAIEHPDEVAGVVLVDGTPAHIYEDFPPALKTYQRDNDKGQIILFQTVATLSRHGVLRLFVQLVGVQPLTFLESYPPETDAQILDMVFLRTQFYETVVDELQAFEESTTQIPASGADPDVPYIVLVRGAIDVGEQASEQDRLLEENWLRLQTELVESLPNGDLVIAEEGDHTIHFSQPEAVIEAIRAIWWENGE